MMIDDTEEQKQPIDFNYDDVIVIIDSHTETSPEDLITKFTVSDPQKYEVEVAVTDYKTEISYLLIETETFTIKIKYSKKQQIEYPRTMQDLEWLRKSIYSKYPGLGVPVYQILTQYPESVKQEKILVVQSFLQFLVQHPTLKFCPELQAFLSNNVEFITFKKQENPEASEIKLKVPRRLDNIIKSLNPFTSTTSNKSMGSSLLQTHSNLYSEHKSVLDYEKVMEETRGVLERMNEFRKRYTNLNEKLEKHQKSIVMKSHGVNLAQLVPQIDRIRGLFRSNQEMQKRRRKQEYLQYRIYSNLVMQNVQEYMQWYRLVDSLCKSITAAKEGTEIGSVVHQQRYLRLLLNNLSHDITYWINYNNILLSKSIPEH